MTDECRHEVSWATKTLANWVPLSASHNLTVAYSWFSKTSTTTTENATDICWHSTARDTRYANERRWNDTAVCSPL